MRVFALTWPWGPPGPRGPGPGRPGAAARRVTSDDDLFFCGQAVIWRADSPPWSFSPSIVRWEIEGCE